MLHCVLFLWLKLLRGGLVGGLLDVLVVELAAGVDSVDLDGVGVG